MNYYVHNLETDKLNIFTGRENWKLLPAELQTIIKRYCLFSRSQSCWISKALGGPSRIWWLDKLKAAGFEDHGTVGEKLSFAEQVEAKQERAEARAERLEARSEKAEAESQQAFDTSHKMMKAIPMGQPILVGHHSETRDRNYRDRAWNLLGRAIHAADKAKHYDDRAEVARCTAAGEKLSDPAFLGRRIAEREVEIRKLLSLLEGKTYVNSVAATHEVSDERRARLEALLSAEMEKIDFYQRQLAALNVTIFNKETLADKTEVKIRGRWEPIVKLNPKTVSVPGVGYTAEIAIKYPFKYAYSQV